MKILHVTAQKHHSTGSGIYMKGLIDGFKRIGIEQAVIAGFDVQDEIFIDNHIKLYPLIYNTEELNFDVLGMSDIMPYKSTKYKDLDDEMIKSLQGNLEKLLHRIMSEFAPDLIICHHLYLGTAVVRNFIKHIPVVGICHGTCLRQLENNKLKRDFIISNIKSLHNIYALHNSQRDDIIKAFGVIHNVITLGTGYNPNMFYNKHIDSITNDYKPLCKDNITITFAGKVIKAKGALSFMKSTYNLKYPKDFITINVVGGSNNEKDFKEIYEASTKSPYNINFIGKVPQEKLCQILNKSHIFVLPSFFEGLPLVILEALACDCRVIVSDLPGIQESFFNGVNESGKISYVNMPRMKNIDTPYEEDLPCFEERLSNAIDKYIQDILEDMTPAPLDISNLSWDKLASKILNRFR